MTIIRRGVLFFCIVFASSISAVEFEYGEVFGTFDTTLSMGQSYRTQDPSNSIIGLSADPAGLRGVDASITGTAFSENSDDGNQNHQDGAISATLKFTSEFEINYKNIGVFTRFNGFKDFINDDIRGDRTAFDDEGIRLVGENIDLQDLYFFADFNIGNMPATVKIGEQVLSWGESTFIQNGINVVNPFDVSKLRTPGSEVRDALLPVGMVSLSVSPTNNLSVDGYYQYDWERTIIEPPGSFFSTNDFVGDGGDRVMLGTGSFSDRGTVFGAAAAGAINGVVANTLDASGFDSDFLAVSRSADRRPDNGGEFGISLKYFAEELNDTEFGFYFIKHHSRTPVISAITGTTAGQVAAGTVGANAAAIVGILTGGGLSAAQAQGLTSAIATHQYSQTASYLIEYPEDIKRYGLSFNTQVRGIALQGEYTFINDAPLQVDDIELLTRALCPLNSGTNRIDDNQLDNGCANTTTSQYLPGFIRRNVSQLQVSATKILGPTFKADTAALVGEVGITHVHNMPEKDVLRLNSAGTFVSGNPNQALTGGGHVGKAAEGFEDFADATSWGYRIAGRLTYNNVFSAINLSPRFAFSHDVSGNTPGPGGNFLEERKALTLGIGADYQNQWRADLSYTNFSGAGRHNLLRDRDFMSFNLQYSF